MVLPLLNLGTSVVKTLSKPIASGLKQKAQLHPRFRQLTSTLPKLTINDDDYPKEESMVTLCMKRKPCRLQWILSKEQLLCIVLWEVDVTIEVQRSAKSEAKKEEKRRQEMKALRQRDNGLAHELEHLKHTLKEIEQLAKGRGLSGPFHVKLGSRKDVELPKPASLDS